MVIVSILNPTTTWKKKSKRKSIVFNNQEILGFIFTSLYQGMSNSISGNN